MKAERLGIEPVPVTCRSNAYRSGGSRICKWGGGGKVERLRRENRCAEGVENFSILSLKMATFSAFWALFLQFIVHSSMDCLKHFRRKKPLLVGKLAVV